MNLKKGDQVVIISGQDKGKTAKIVAVLKNNKVLLDGEGIKFAKHHEKPSNSNPDGGIVDKAIPIDASNVMLVVGKDKQRTRVGYKTITQQSKKKNSPAVSKKVRYSVKTQEVLD
ncbi:50S ribosomal protein L24 [bacterium]|nr:50S ribosomal protein L24 [bacterium]